MISTFVCLQQGWNAVHMAAAGDYDDILELLFENGAEMDARDLVVSWCCP
jgi:ankyrin repeat protein